MLIPIIKVKDRDSIHIVGTNSHDTLYIDEATGGIHYLDLQCFEGTKKYDGESTMEFVPKELEESDVYPQIEFVTLEELIKIATENMCKQTEEQIGLHKVIEETMSIYLKAKAECEDKLKQDSMKDTSGRIIF